MAPVMYSARQVANVLGVPSGRLRSYMRAGFVIPERANNGELQFTFQDLVLLRKAEGLAEQQLPARRISEIMRHAQQAAGARPLCRFDFAADGAVVVVEEGDLRWNAESGQLLFDFDRQTENKKRERFNDITDLDAVRAEQSARNQKARNQEAVDLPGRNARECFEKALRIEDEAPNEAIELYQQCLFFEPDHADAHVNLGRLLHESGHPEAAQVHYRMALSVRPEDATASFNLGVALEDIGMRDESIRAYQISIACDASNADAHYNLARLLEQTGQGDLAIRHLLLYRQLTRQR